MKLSITDASAAALGTLAVTAKIFTSLILDCPELCNSAWIAALLGMLFTLPFAVVLCILRRYQPECRAAAASAPLLRFLFAGFAAAYAFDAAVTAVNIATSASYIAIGNVTTFYLLLPQFALCLWCLRFNGDALGSAARIWTSILLCIIGIIAILILPRYRPAWLMPVLGPGIPTLFTASVRCAGWYSLLLPLFLLSERSCDEGRRRRRPVLALLTAGLVSCALLLLFGMLSPSAVNSAGATRFSRMDTLLSNGRLSLSLQMPMIVLWFAALFFLILFDTWMLAASLQTCIPKLKNLPCICIAIGMVVVISFTALSGRDGNLAEGFLFLLIPASLLILTAVCTFRKGGRHA